MKVVLRYRDTSDPDAPRAGYLADGQLVWASEAASAADVAAACWAAAGTGYGPRLFATLAAACPLVEAVSTPTPGDASAVVVGYAADPGDDGRAAVAAALAAFDWSAATQAAWDAGRTRARVLAGLFSRTDDTAVAVRMVLRAVVTLINDRLAALGQSRVTEADIAGLVAAHPELGDPTG